MKTNTIIVALMLLIPAQFFIASCKSDKNDDPTPSNASYFTATVKFNSTTPQSYVCDEYTFDARVNATVNDTLVFEGERSADASYMYFNLITDDLYSYKSGDSISIPYDFTTGTEVFCSLLINSVSSNIFQPGGGSGGTQGKIYIDEIDYTRKYLKGRMYGTFYSLNDTLKVTNANFLIDL